MNCLAVKITFLNLDIYTLCLRINFVFLYANARAYVLANVTSTNEIMLEYKSIKCILQNNPETYIIMRLIKNVNLTINMFIRSAFIIIVS